jgi:hypothetical protein
MPGAKPHAADPIININIPVMNIFFLPSLSPNEPPNNISEASINK